MNQKAYLLFQKVSVLTRKLPTWGWTLISGLWFLLLLVAIFGKFLRHPGKYLYGAGMDPIKNYYTFLYHVKYNAGTRFTGMNYPFGEHITFPDTQPALAIPLSFINQHIAPISQYSLGFLNAFLILSMAITGVMLFLVLRKNLLPPLYSLIAAALILFLSPQHFRITGHYGLAYTFIIPTLWYITIRIFENRRQWVWYLTFALFAFFGALLHTYFAIMATLFLLSYAFVFALQEWRHFRKNVWFLAALFLTAISPVVLFQLWLSLTDLIRDRPQNPYGFFVFHSDFASVFYPWISPYKETWQTLFNTPEPNVEGKAYVGIIGLACFILTMVHVLLYLIRFRLKAIFRPVLPLPLRIGIWAATLVLLFSMAYPFRLGLQNLVELLPQLKQFRSLGRFAWVFYYVFSVYAAFYFYQLYRYLSRRQALLFGAGLLATVLFIWYLDARINIGRELKFMQEYDQAGYFTEPENNYTQYLQSVNRQPSEFQAILPLPYYAIGTEKFSIEGSGQSIFETFRASLDTGLPVATGIMSRTSLTQGLQLLQLLSHDLLEKEVLQKFPNQKPFLLIYSKETPLEAFEQRLLAKGTKLFENEKTALYELPLQSLRSSREATVQEFKQQQGQLISQNGIFSDAKTENVVYLDFSTSSAAEGLAGSGALMLPQAGTFTIFDGFLPAADTTMFEASVWVNVRKTKGLPLFKVRQFTPDATVLVEEKATAAGRSIDIFQDWVRVAIPFRLYGPKNRLEFSFEGESIIADNFLLKPLNQDVYFYGDQKKMLFYNNFPIQY